VNGKADLKVGLSITGLSITGLSIAAMQIEFDSITPGG
jgi:hypothetical protein